MVTVTITYLMSGQLLEWDRFLFFSITAMVTGMCAEGFGYAVSSIYNAKVNKRKNIRIGSVRIIKYINWPMEIKSKHIQNSDLPDDGHDRLKPDTINIFF